MGVKNFRNGRLIVRSGDATPLSHTVTFVNAGLSLSQPQNVVTRRNRGATSGAHVIPGVEENVTLSLTADFLNRTLYRLLRHGVWPDHAETLTGLTGGANNADVDLAYRMEQGSLAIASSETGTWTKLANDGTPTTQREFSEKTGGTHPDGLTSVPAFGTALSSGAMDVFQPSADTDLAIVYDAVGASTYNPSGVDAGKRTFEIWIEMLDVADPTTVRVRWTLGEAWLTEWSLEEGEEADTVSFTLEALELTSVEDNP